MVLCRAEKKVHKIGHLFKLNNQRASKKLQKNSLQPVLWKQVVNYWLGKFFNFYCASSSIVSSQKPGGVGNVYPQHWTASSTRPVTSTGPADNGVDKTNTQALYQEKMFSLFNQCSACLQSRKHFPGTLQTLGYLLHAHDKRENESTNKFTNEFTECIK